MIAAPTANPGSATGRVPDSSTYRVDYTTGAPNYRTFGTRMSGTAANGGQIYFTTNNSGFTSAIKLTKDVASFTQLVGSVTGGWQAALIDSTVSGVTDSTPLILTMLGIGVSYNGVQNGVQGGWATLPGVTDLATPNQSYNWTVGVTPAAVYYSRMPGGNTSNAVDKWLGDKVTACRMAAFHAANGTTPLQFYGTWGKYLGWARGLLKEEFLCIGDSGTIGTFDTLTIGANADWTVISTAFGLWNTTATGGAYMITRAI
jgi:hypothetical protein